MHNHLPTPSDQRRARRRLAVGAGSVLGSGAIVAAVLTLGGAVNADGPPPTLPGPTSPPIITIPGLTVVPTTIPFITIPGLTIVPTTAPGDPDATDPADPDDPAPGTSPDADPSDPGASDPGAGGTAAEPVEPYLEITSATIDCAGLVHVEYETGAVPEPAATTEHVVVVSPIDDPATVLSQRLTEQATNGQFVLDVPTVPMPQRVVVVADFEPANPDGIILVDEADAMPAADCPVTTG